jgi:hypothetical protein
MLAKRACARLFILTETRRQQELSVFEQSFFRCGAAFAKSKGGSASLVACAPFMLDQRESVSASRM